MGIIRINFIKIFDPIQFSITKQAALLKIKRQTKRTHSVKTVIITNTDHC